MRVAALIGLATRSPVANRLATRALCTSTGASLRPIISRHAEGLAQHCRGLESQNESNFCAERAREIARLQPVLDAHARISKDLEDAAQLREVAADASAEEELRELARLELAESEEALDRQHDELLSMIVPPQEDDDATAVLLEVHAGVGGVEAHLFAQEVFDMYERLAKRRRWRWEPLSTSEHEQGGVREATATLRGEGAHAALRGENGTHRVQRVPATESQGRVHTSTATVLVLPEVAASESQLDEKDVQATPSHATNVSIVKNPQAPERNAVRCRWR